MVVDCRERESISLPLLQSYDLDGVDFVLFCTGWDKKWGSPDYYEGFPCLTADAAAYLAALPLKGVGEDTISLDPCDSVDFPQPHRAAGCGLRQHGESDGAGRFDRTAVHLCDAAAEI